MNRDIIFITFDIFKSDYPSMPYSIACLIASIKKEGYVASHYSVDVKQILVDRPHSSNYKDGRNLSLEELKKQDEKNRDVATIVESRLLSSIDYFKTFRFVAISVSRWSIEHCNRLARHLKENNYQGKIVFGGYEITACKDEELKVEFPSADIYSKGYAELTYIDLLKGEDTSENKILKGRVYCENLVSPYLEGVLSTYSRKLYWETKRGCTFNCNFCEWGALDKEEKQNIKTIEIDKQRLFQEIDLFSKAGVEELNILDGTFNWGKQYLEILEYVMKKSDLKVVLQTRYESVTKDFLNICEQYKDRIHLEFGLQTIHPTEMETIGRKNNIEKVESIIKDIVNRNLSFETSIIYAIPGQTMESFIDTIEFLLINGCKKIRAFPLELARNSNLATSENREKWKIVTETDPETKYCTVNSCRSFYSETRKDMDKLAQRLLTEDRLYDGKAKNNGIVWEDVPNAKYQKRFKSLGNSYDVEYLYYLIGDFYEHQTIVTTADFFSLCLQLGSRYEESCSENYTMSNHIKKILSPDYCIEDPIRPEKNTSIQLDNGQIVNLNRIPNDIKYYCELRAGRSGNLYVYRRVVKDGKEVSECS